MIKLDSVYFSLKVTSGPAVSKSVVFSSGNALTFGRLESNDCVLSNDAAISRRHFEISFASDGCWIRDLDSRNGTYLNNHNILKSELNSGDEIRVGSTKMVVQLEPARPDHDADVDEPAKPAALANLNTGARILFQNKDDTTVFMRQSLGTTRIRRNVLLSSAFGDTFFDLPGKALLINAPDVRDNLKETRDAERIGSQAVLVYPATLDHCDELRARYYGQDALILMNHVCPRSQLRTLITDLFRRFKSPSALLAAIKQLPAEISQALLSGVDFVCCEEADPEEAVILYADHHSDWIKKAIHP